MPHVCNAAARPRLRRRVNMDRIGPREARDLFVYYRVAVADATAFRAAVLAMQQRLAAECDVATALKRRPEPSNGEHTWMEVYSGVAADFDDRLAAAAERAGLFQWIIGSRHAEHFLDVSSCA